MACCATTPEQKVSKARNKEIESQLRKDKQNYRIKLLLLGAGESGKSTIAKQMKIIHLNGYNKDEERLRFRQFVFSNVFDNMIALIEAANSFGYSLTGANKEAANRIIAIQDDYKSADAKTLPKDIADDFKKLWADDAIQQAYIRSSEFQLGDSCEYFFSSLDRIAEENFIPTVADILRVRTKTTGINEIEFSIGKYNFRMTDVGGQRSERRKWIHCFEDVTAIIFCAALSEYDQKLYEDQSVNRMLEAIKLFSDTTNSRWFHETPIILFLNKADLFEKKIAKVPLNVCFKNYTGPNTPKEASEFIEKQFTSQIRNPNKLVYVYKTTATDTSNVKFVFRAVKDIFITAYLNHLGIGIGPGGPAPGLPSAPPPTKTERSESTERADNGKQEA